MKEIKPHLSYQKQIEKLRSRRCTIHDEEFCKWVLINTNYYRLSAYFLPFLHNEMYEENTEFEKIFHLYEFDRKLRGLLFASIEIIEVSFRAKIAYFHSSKYGPLGYLDPKTFNNHHNKQKFDETINREIENNKKVLFVRHYIENYDGQFPLWVISELFSFGTLSRFYNDLTTADKKEFVRLYYNTEGTNYKNMESWLRCCTDLRNICAHYGRLYYRVFTAVPAGFNIRESQKHRLWGAILTIKELFPFAEDWNTVFLEQLKNLFIHYKDDISLYHLAFPKDWLEQLKK